jgi:hypothetical protein
MPRVDISFLMIVSLDRHNLPEIDNSLREGIHRIQIDVVNRSIVRECHLSLGTHDRDVTAYF